MVDADVDLPLTVGEPIRVTETGDARLITGPASLRRSLTRRVLCASGGMLAAPEYGGGLSDSVETAMSVGRRSQLAHQLRRQVLRDDRVAEAKVTVSLGDEAGTIHVTIAVETFDGDSDLIDLTLG